MKKLLLALGLSFLFSTPALPAAADCVLSTGCSASNVCAWSNAGHWTSCDSSTPGDDVGDRVTIGADDYVIYDVGSLASPLVSDAGVYALDVFGVLIFDESDTNRDADGYRVLGLSCSGGQGIHIRGGGKIIMRKGDRIDIDVSEQQCDFQVTNGGLLDAQGEIYETTISAITVGDAASTPCGNTVGQLFTITPASGILRARPGTRIRFKTGMATARQYEVIDQTDEDSNGVDDSFRVCTDFDDEDGIGNRLTPHGEFTGTARTTIRFVNLHSVPCPGPNARCTADNVPWSGCTGAGTGKCIAATPAVGDEITIIQDVHVINKVKVAAVFPDTRDCIGSNNPWNCCSGANAGACEANLANQSGSSQGQDPTPILYAANIQGGIAIGVRTEATTRHDVMYLNIHEGNASGTFNYMGAKDQTFAYNAIHDDDSAAGDAQCAMCAFNCLTSSNTCGAGSGNAEAWDPDNIKMYGNIGYRTKGIAMGIGLSGGPSFDNPQFYDNYIFDGCLTNSGECNAMELWDSTNAKVHNNVIHDIYRGTSAGTKAFSVPTLAAGDSTNMAMYQNWVVNIDGSALNGDGTALMSHNYVANVFGPAGQSGNFIGNIVKESGLGDATTFVFSNPNSFDGNFVLGTTALADGGADCATQCARHMINLTSLYPNDDAAAWSSTDNIFVGLSNGSYGACYFLPSSNIPDYSINISHATYNGLALDNDKALYRRDADAAIALTITDSVTYNLGLLAATSINCQGGTSGTVSSSGIYSLLDGIAIQSGGTINGNCVTEGATAEIRMEATGFTSGVDYNFTYVNGATLLTAGTGSEAIGARAFNFDTRKLNDRWGGVLPFDAPMPTNFSNGTSNIDTDGDGIMDLFDNCDYTVNQAQVDADADSKGCACDSDEACP